ncbi:MAG: DoxX family protein [candidate division Zixibacteria bacterium]|nr:DoxX family protein [candidate division Zixibacteria bacterium]
MPSLIHTLLFGKFQTPSRGIATDLGLLILRLGVSLPMMNHGFGKLTSFTELSATFPDPLGVGTTVSLGLTVFAEFFCAIAVALGLFTRPSTIPLIITMLVAAFIVNANAAWADQELAVVFMAGFVAILVAGPGRISMDKVISH